mgnify:CR=1 FL=1
MGDSEADEKRYGPLDTPDEEVTESCGCVFCDLDDPSYTLNGKRVHDYIGPDGRLVLCTKPDQN